MSNSHKNRSQSGKATGSIPPGSALHGMLQKIAEKVAERLQKEATKRNENKKAN